MKSSEESFSTLDSTFKVEDIVIPEELKNQLLSTLQSIHKILIDNKEFYKKLIEKCLLVGSGHPPYVYWDHISQMLLDEYPKLLHTSYGQSLYSTINQFLYQLCCSEPPFDQLHVDIPRECWGILRSELDDIVMSNYNDDIDLLGD